MGLASGSWIALCGVAFALGIRHGFDADHLTVIDGIARRNIRTQPWVARMAGVLFSLGHGVLVLSAATAALVLAVRWRTPAWLEVSGTLIAVVFLLGLGTLNLRSAWKTPNDQVVRPAGLRSRLFRGTGSDHPLAIAAVGMLFAISFDTLSQAGAISLAASHFGGLTHALAAVGCFTLGMLIAGGLNGLWISHLIGAANRRALVASRVMTTAVGLLNLTVGLLALSTLASPALRGWSNDHALGIGAGVIAAAILAFAIAKQMARLQRRALGSFKLSAFSSQPRLPTSVATDR